MKVLLLGVMLLAIVQAANSQDPIEREFKVSKLLEEQYGSVGTGLSTAEVIAPLGAEQATDPGVVEDYHITGVITLRLVNYFSTTGIKVFVNGVEKANFLNKDITIQVRPGDQIALDGSAFFRAALVQVLNTSPEVVSPKEGSTIELKGDVKYLAPVQVKPVRKLRQ